MARSHWQNSRRPMQPWPEAGFGFWSRPPTSSRPCTSQSRPTGAPGARCAAKPSGCGPGQQSRNQIAQSAKKERQAREKSALIQAHMPRLAQIRRQPGNVEIPAVGDAEILQAEQPGRRAGENFRPRHMSVAGKVRFRAVEKRQFFFAHAGVLAAWIVSRKETRSKTTPPISRRSCRRSQTPIASSSNAS